MITIKVKVDPEETDSKLNQASIRFPKIETFVKNGPEVAEVQLKLHNEIFLPQGQTGPKDVDKRLGTFKRICEECLYRRNELRENRIHQQVFNRRLRIEEEVVGSKGQGVLRLVETGCSRRQAS